ncbi:MAG: hypothetical protein Q8S55_09645 [Methylococcaceae bacterium]|nr:hypothetical protein [Methylococcaceae bacterium]
MSNKTTKRKDKKEFGVISLGLMGGELALRTMPFSVEPFCHAATKGAR